MRFKIVLLLSVLLIYSPEFAAGADIHGIVYDIGLNRVREAQLTINTTPMQRQITNNSTYTFTLPIGIYSITAEHSEGGILKASTQDKITIKETGSYVYDLVLFPVVSEDISEEIEVSTTFLGESKRRWTDFVVIILFLCVLGIAVYLFQKRKTSMLVEIKDHSLAELIGFIQKAGGRTTQKEIRKALPQSEAKISLMIAELEEKQLIKKIKRGRGNIIVLVHGRKK